MSAPAGTTLLTVSGTIPDELAEQVAAGARPRVDYVAIAERCGADLIDYRAARADLGPRLSRLARRVPDDVVLAVACFRRRRRYDTILTDGEQVGIPLAGLTRFGRRPRHVMIAHWLSPRVKRLAARAVSLRRGVDTVVVYASAQRRVAVEQLGFAAEQVELSPFMVDADFWNPARFTPTRRARPLICAAGLEQRDYPTLLAAVDGLDVDVVITAGSLWSKRTDSTEGHELPANVTVTRLPYDELRQLYSDAAFVVMPLFEVDFQAGITTILEAMSMGKAVVCSRVSGQSDVIVDGVTGRYATAADPAALRATIAELLADPAKARALGAAARDWVLANATLDHYVERFAVLAGA